MTDLHLHLRSLFSIPPSFTGTSGGPSQSQSPRENPGQRTRTSNPAPLIRGPSLGLAAPAPQPAGQPGRRARLKPSPSNPKTPRDPPKSPLPPTWRVPLGGRPRHSAPWRLARNSPPLPRPVRTRLRAGPRPPERASGGRGTLGRSAQRRDPPSLAWPRRRVAKKRRTASSTAAAASRTASIPLGRPRPHHPWSVPSPFPAARPPARGLPQEVPVAAAGGGSAELGRAR